MQAYLEGLDLLADVRQVTLGEDDAHVADQVLQQDGPLLVTGLLHVQPDGALHHGVLAHQHHRFGAQALREGRMAASGDVPPGQVLRSIAEQVAASAWRMHGARKLAAGSRMQHIAHAACKTHRTDVHELLGAHVVGVHQEGLVVLLQVGAQLAVIL